jgi:hypothetical protein
MDWRNYWWIERMRSMLETPQERVKLLKVGINIKTIEKLYVVYNNFKIVRTPILIEVVEISEV